MKTLKEKAKRMTARFLAVVVLMFGVTSMAHADDDMWGCEVLLCLSNPAGPTAVGECVPPITKLWKHLAKGHSFPSCGLAQGNDDTQNYARQVYDAFDPCSMTSMDEAPQGYVAEGTKKQSNQRWSIGASNFNLTKSPAFNGKYWAEYGGGDSSYETQAKACVKGFSGSYTYGASRDNSGTTVNVYQQVAWQKAKSPRAIDVFVNGKQFTRVHW